MDFDDRRRATLRADRQAVVRGWTIEQLVHFFELMGLASIPRAIRYYSLLNGRDLVGMYGSGSTDPNRWNGTMQAGGLPHTSPELARGLAFVQALLDPTSHIALREEVDEAFDHILAEERALIRDRERAQERDRALRGARERSERRPVAPAAAAVPPDSHDIYEAYIRELRGLAAAAPAAAAAYVPAAAAGAARMPAAASSSAALASSATSVRYPLELFLDPASVQDLLCDMPGCGEVVSNPLSMNCEHKFCRSCIEGWTAATCPTCREPYGDLGGRLNKQMIGAIFKKRVRCEHHQLGCTAEFDIGADNRGILGHRSACKFEPITCTRCGDKVARVKVEEHDTTTCVARLVPCAHCDTQVSVRDLKTHQVANQDPVSGDWPKCNSTVLCATRCRDAHGLIRVFKPSEIVAHEAVCKARVRPCSMCPPYEKCAMAYDALMRHYKSKITSIDHALQVLLMQTFAEPRVAASAPADSARRGENLRQITSTRNLNPLNSFHDLTKLPATPPSAAAASSSAAAATTPSFGCPSSAAAALSSSTPRTSSTSFDGDGLQSPIRRPPTIAMTPYTPSFSASSALVRATPAKAPAAVAAASASSPAAEPPAPSSASAASAVSLSPRHFTAALRIGSPIEVYAKTTDEWKLAFVTALEPLVIRAKAVDGKKYIKPRDSTNLRAAQGVNATAVVTPPASMKKRKRIIEISDEECAEETAADRAFIVPDDVVEYMDSRDDPRMPDEEEETKQASKEDEAEEDQAMLSDTSDEGELDGEDAMRSSVAFAATPTPSAASSSAHTPAAPLTEKELKQVEKWLKKLHPNSVVDYFDASEYRCWRLGRVDEINHAEGTVVVRPGVRPKLGRKEDPVSLTLSSSVLVKPKTRSRPEIDKAIEQADRQAMREQQKRRKLNEPTATPATPSKPITPAAPATPSKPVTTAAPVTPPSAAPVAAASNSADLSSRATAESTPAPAAFVPFSASIFAPAAAGAPSSLVGIPAAARAPVILPPPPIVVPSSPFAAVSPVHTPIVTPDPLVKSEGSQLTVINEGYLDEEMPPLEKSPF